MVPNSIRKRSYFIKLRVALAEAREKASAQRALLTAGRNPLDERRAALAVVRGSMTFSDCAEAFITAHAPGWRNAKHGDQWRNTLVSYAFPTMGRSAREHHRHPARPEGVGADLDVEDGDCQATPWPDRKRARLGNGAAVPGGREPGALARASGQTPRTAVEGCKSAAPPGIGLR